MALKMRWKTSWRKPKGSVGRVLGAPDFAAPAPRSKNHESRPLRRLGQGGWFLQAGEFVRVGGGESSCGYASSNVVALVAVTAVFPLSKAEGLCMRMEGGRSPGYQARKLE